MVVVNGSQALDLVARVLIEPGDRILVDPLLPGHARGAARGRSPGDGGTVDRHGLDPAVAAACFVTPLAPVPELRHPAAGPAPGASAVGGARTFVEDDYDGEFRYDRRALESLQGLDGTGPLRWDVFAHVFPLRIGYLVVPRRLVAAFHAAEVPVRPPYADTLEQETLAEFIRTGCTSAICAAPPAQRRRPEALLDALRHAWRSRRAHLRRGRRARRAVAGQSVGGVGGRGGRLPRRRRLRDLAPTLPSGRRGRDHLGYARCASPTSARA